MLCGDGGLVQRSDLVKGRVDLEEHFLGLLHLSLDLLPLTEQPPHLQLIWGIDELVLEQYLKLDLLTAKLGLFLQLVFFDVLTHNVWQSCERQLDRLESEQGLRIVACVTKDFEFENLFKFIDFNLCSGVVLQVK